MRTLITLAFAASCLLGSLPARAAITDGLGHWQGSGTTIAPDGTALGDFTVEVERTAVDARTVDVRGKVTLQDGQTFTFTERQIAGSNGGFITESPRGKAYGRCFGEGMCQSYEDQGDGKARAMTIVSDGPDKLRVLITELDQGRAVRFLRQTLRHK